MLIRKHISGLCLLFSSKRVCCHCGARHNAETDLFGTYFVCANRLRAKGTHFNRIIRITNVKTQNTFKIEID